jgi:KDO2-lipid IV(A) lauroyltransferase
MEKTGYFLLRVLTWILHLFPLRVLYLISDLIFVFTYTVFKYRRNVVNKNLANSFPEKTKKERDQIAWNFYRHLCDTVIETLYFDQISVAGGKKCVKYLNAELPNSYLDQGRDVIVFLGHYNNWEWFANWPLYSKHRFYPIYKKIKSPVFEHFYYNMRSRFGAVPLDRSATFRQLVSDHQNGIPTISAFLFDQTPRVFDIQHWVTFLNQKTPVILGAEKVAQKLDAVVLFAKSRKVKRGEYEIEYLRVTTNAATTPKFEITDQCTRILEQQIIENPEFWLWSHKRWKHKPEKPGPN